VTPKPLPPSEIKAPTSIGIAEGRGGSAPAPNPRPPKK
jgi:hypothetical protein